MKIFTPPPPSLLIVDPLLGFEHVDRESKIKNLKVFNEYDELLYTHLSDNKGRDISMAQHANKWLTFLI